MEKPTYGFSRKVHKGLGFGQDDFFVSAFSPAIYGQKSPPG
jgi:hypothetical protein